VMLDSLHFSAAAQRTEVEKALEFVQLADKRDVMGVNLNAFERRMVELAKTLVGSPKVVLLDEPGAGMRPNEVSILRQVILRIRERFGAMTLLIDHDVELIASTCESTLVLDFGQVIAFGSTTEVLRDGRVKAAYLGIEEVA